MHSRVIEIAKELGISNSMLAARRLHACEEADYLEVAECGANGRAHLLVPAAANAWQLLTSTARRDGIALFIVSAFRSIERQAEIVRRKLAAGITIAETLTVCAPPGFSEHHTGHAVDISTPGIKALEVEFDQTAAFFWLMQHANDFGFYLSYPMGNSQGYQYEPWHWCYYNTYAGNKPDRK